MDSNTRALLDWIAAERDAAWRGFNRRVGWLLDETLEQWPFALLGDYASNPQLPQPIDHAELGALAQVIADQLLVVACGGDLPVFGRDLRRFVSADLTPSGRLPLLQQAVRKALVQPRQVGELDGDPTGRRWMRRYKLRATVTPREIGKAWSALPGGFQASRNASWNVLVHPGTGSRLELLRSPDPRTGGGARVRATVTGHRFGRYVVAEAELSDAAFAAVSAVLATLQALLGRLYHECREDWVGLLLTTLPVLLALPEHHNAALTLLVRSITGDVELTVQPGHELRTLLHAIRTPSAHALHDQPEQALPAGTLVVAKEGSLGMVERFAGDCCDPRLIQVRHVDGSLAAYDLADVTIVGQPAFVD